MWVPRLKKRQEYLAINQRVVHLYSRPCLHCPMFLPFPSPSLFVNPHPSAARKVRGKETANKSKGEMSPFFLKCPERFQETEEGEKIKE